jgi:hypothetical protein
MTRVIPRVIALLATYNEERFVAGCLERLPSSTSMST